MMSTAHSMIMRAYETGRPLATLDRETERHLIDNLFMAYSPAPLMVLTQKGVEYAEKEIAWLGRAS